MPVDRHKPVSRQALEQGYELPGVNLKGLTLFVVFFILAAVVLHAALWVLLKYYVGERRPIDQPLSAIAPVGRLDEPRLQPVPEHDHLPWQDLQALMNEKNATFGQIGWSIDPQTGAAVVPSAVIRKLAAAQAAAGAAEQPIAPPGRWLGDALPESTANPPVTAQAHPPVPRPASKEQP